MNRINKRWQAERVTFDQEDYRAFLKGGAKPEAEHGRTGRATEAGQPAARPGPNRRPLTNPRQGRNRQRIKALVVAASAS